MARIFKTVVMTLLFLGMAYAQEEASAELFLDDYSDDFQESFFEALTQKGIENYDRARDALLVAQSIKPENRAVMHELSKVYLQLKDYPNAETTALDVLLLEPANPWFLEVYIKVLAVQGKPFETMAPDELRSHPEVGKNLVKVFYTHGQWALARKWLQKLPQNDFKSAYTAKLDQMAPPKPNQGIATAPEVQDAPKKENPMQAYTTQLENLLDQGKFKEAAQVSGEALELFPAQPYLYYAKGQALLQTGKPKEAVGYLKDGLDFLLEEGPLANQLYKTLGDAYTALGDQNKANTYFSKIIQ
jgi:predicted Zn-dependent protease